MSKEILDKFDESHLRAEPSVEYTPPNALGRGWQ